MKAKLILIFLFVLKLCFSQNKIRKPIIEKPLQKSTLKVNSSKNQASIKKKIDYRYSEDKEAQKIFKVIDKFSKAGFSWLNYSNYGQADKENLYVVYDKDRKYGVLDSNLKIIIPVQYDYIESYSDGIFHFEKRGVGHFFIKKDGNFLTENAYRGAGNFYRGIALVITDKWGVLKRDGTYLIEPQYERIATISSSPITFSNIDENGVAIFQNTLYFSEGLLFIKKNGKCGFIDRNNNIIIPFIYDFPKNIFRFDDIFFKEGLAGIVLNGKLGFIDKNNNVKIPFIYDEETISQFRNGMSWVKISEKGFYINKEGKCVKDCNNAPSNHPRQ